MLNHICITKIIGSLCIKTKSNRNFIILKICFFILMFMMYNQAFFGSANCIFRFAIFIYKIIFLRNTIFFLQIIKIRFIIKIFNLIIFFNIHFNFLSTYYQSSTAFVSDFSSVCSSVIFNLSKSNSSFSLQILTPSSFALSSLLPAFSPTKRTSRIVFFIF